MCYSVTACAVVMAALVTLGEVRRVLDVMLFAANVNWGAQMCVGKVHCVN